MIRITHYWLFSLLLFLAAGLRAQSADSAITQPYPMVPFITPDPGQQPFDRSRMSIHSDGDYFVWSVRIRRNREDLGTTRWVSLAGKQNSLLVGKPGLTQSWQIELSDGKSAGGRRTIIRQISGGEPRVDVTATSKLRTTKQGGIITASSPNGGSIRLDVRIERVSRDIAARAYPAKALRQGVQGIVLLTVELDPSARVLSAHVHKATTPETFDAAALMTAALGRYHPVLGADGKPIAAAFMIPVAYVIDGTPEAERARHAMKLQEQDRQ